MTTAVVICPGRGSYAAGELGYLARHFPEPALLARFEAIRAAEGQVALAALDSASRFSPGTHLRGDNASALIFAASLGDFLAIDRDRVEVVAVTGNSMGWYTALACGGAVAPEAGFEIANTMGRLMHETAPGGQLLYPWLGPDWRAEPARKAALLGLVAEIDAREGQALALSIDLGGFLVLAGDEAGLRAFEAAVPRIEARFPMRLAHHAAFHSPLMAAVAERGRGMLPAALFGQPRLPLIDGRGAIWWPGASEPEALWDYTLGAQVTETYDFTRAVTVAAREFAPDLFILAGPGTGLAGAVAQSLVLAHWRGMESKADYTARQAAAPLLACMGDEAQRPLVARAG